MKFWVGVTDNNWYKFLANLQPDEVNFWQPSAKPPFTSAPMGLPFLFKLKRPYNHIAGGGFFVTYSSLPLPWHGKCMDRIIVGSVPSDELRNMIRDLLQVIVSMVQ